MGYVHLQWLVGPHPYWGLIPYLLYFAVLPAIIRGMIRRWDDDE